MFLSADGTLCPVSGLCFRRATRAWQRRVRTCSRGPWASLRCPRSRSSQSTPACAGGRTWHLVQTLWSAKCETQHESSLRLKPPRQCWTSYSFMSFVANFSATPKTRSTFRLQIFTPGRSPQYFRPLRRWAGSRMFFTGVFTIGMLWLKCKPWRSLSKGAEGSWSQDSSGHNPNIWWRWTLPSSCDFTKSEGDLMMSLPLWTNTVCKDGSPMNLNPEC